MGNRVKAIDIRIAALLVTAGIALLCVAGQASAAKVHVYSKSFGEAKGELSLTTESAVAVSEQTGEVYVADTGHSRVAKFSALGIAEGSLATIPTPTFVAVDNSATSPSKGDVYVVGEGDKTITKLTPAGIPVSGWGADEGGERKGRLIGFNEVNGIAVDSEGDLWVFNIESSSQATVTEFGQAQAESLHSYTVHAHGSPYAEEAAPAPDGAAFLAFGYRKAKGQAIEAGGLAVDSNGLNYVYSELGTSPGAYVRLNSNGESDFFNRTVWLKSPIEGFLTSGIATEAGTDDVYAGHVQDVDGVGINVTRLTAGGRQYVERFGGGYEGLHYRELGEAERRLERISGIAVNSGTGELYVVDPSAKSPHVVAYSLEEVEPPSAGLEVGEVTRHTAKLIGHIDPNAPTGRAHEVAWRVVCSPACPGYDEPSYIEADGTEHVVEVTLEGLTAGTNYSVRLQAENRGGKTEPVQPFSTAPDAPSVADELASEIYGGAATLHAKINPSGAATTYHFEYMTRQAFEAGGFGASGTQRTPDSELPYEPEPQAHAVSYRISGLQPGTDYVYRAVAVNSVGPTDGAPVNFRSQVGANPLDANCPNEALRTEGGARLPDCRAYELVSPENKAGSLVEPFLSNLQAAVGGSSVTWFTADTASGIPATGGAHQDPAFYLSTLGGGSWSSQRLLAPETIGRLSDLVGLTADQKYGLIEASALAGVDPALYLVDTSNQVLTTVVPPQTGKTAEQRPFSYAGSAAGDSFFFFESRLQLNSKAAAGKDNLYMWNRLTGVLSLVGVLPGSKGEAPAGGSFAGAYAWPGGGNSAGVAYGGAEQGMYVEAIHAISESGERAYFTAGETAQIYLRSGLSGSKPTTVRVSVANAGVTDPHGQQPAAFQEATPEGEMAYFLSSGKLTADANTGLNDEGADLYRYDAKAKASEALVDVTPLNGGAGAQVQGVLGVSADGKSGFLVAQGVLDAGGTGGENNIYYFEDTGNGFAYRFVATLSPDDTSDWSGNSAKPKQARVSKDGATLLVMSVGIDGAPAGKCVYGRCAQVYRYSVGEGAPACLSCNPTGEGPWKFGAELSMENPPVVGPHNGPLEGTGNPSSAAIYGTLPRNLSPSGSRVFFQTSEPLLPEDVNGLGPEAHCITSFHCVDVYEWEAVGSGSCRAADQAGGCLYLISTGESDTSSYFLDASGGEGEGGENVFIVTISSLVPVDHDELSDAYDARVDGGLPGQHIEPGNPCASLEACKAPGAGAPPATSPSTPFFQGPGNPKQVRCKKGFVKKHGKCVKKPKSHGKKKSQKQKKHHKNGHHKKKRTAGQKYSGGSK